MLRSMYSGISGMKNFQTKLDVIGNNIANVSTYGFKKGRITFKDMISQETQGASAPQGGRGGTNAKQVGLGVDTASIDNIQGQGSLQNTGRNLDLAISGDGFFVVKDGNQTYYTRAGNFYLDGDGYIVNADGMKVQGTKGPIQISKNGLKEFSIGKSGEITGVDASGKTVNLGQIQIATFNNPEGLEKAGGTLFQQSPNSGPAFQSNPGQNGAGELAVGELEMSNVDLSEEFTSMIEAQRGFQANSRIITTSDQILEELVNLKR
ncbi:flagellar basal body rod protein FlgG [Scopulibacillus cellulosilyticus]|uniref:Flagellar basal body rod protein FlgG n=1 Tax=Scopulibacillus cellulosilyticus TaxID=2665665 RepID=A0ABW2PW79_9BACL